MTLAFYSSTTAFTYVDWIVSRHYSAKYALMYLTFHEMLPVSVDKVCA